MGRPRGTACRHRHVRAPDAARTQRARLDRQARRWGRHRSGTRSATAADLARLLGTVRDRLRSLCDWRALRGVDRVCLGLATKGRRRVCCRRGPRARCCNHTRRVRLGHGLRVDLHVAEKAIGGGCRRCGDGRGCGCRSVVLVAGSRRRHAAVSDFEAHGTTRCGRCRARGRRRDFERRVGDRSTGRTDRDMVAWPVVSPRRAARRSQPRRTGGARLGGCRLAGGRLRGGGGAVTGGLRRDVGGAWDGWGWP